MRIMIYALHYMFIGVEIVMFEAARYVSSFCGCLRNVNSANSNVLPTALQIGFLGRKCFLLVRKCVDHWKMKIYSRRTEDLSGKNQETSTQNVDLSANTKHQRRTLDHS